MNKFKKYVLCDDDRSYIFRLLKQQIIVDDLLTDYFKKIKHRKTILLYRKLENDKFYGEQYE